MPELSYNIKIHTNKCDYLSGVYYEVLVLYKYSHNSYLLMPFTESEYKNFENIIETLPQTETIRQIHVYASKLNLKCHCFNSETNMEELLGVYKALERHINLNVEDRKFDIISTGVGHYNIFYDGVLISSVINNEIERISAFSPTELEKLNETIDLLKNKKIQEPKDIVEIDLRGTTYCFCRIKDQEELEIFEQSIRVCKNDKNKKYLREIEGYCTRKLYRPVGDLKEFNLMELLEAIRNLP